MGMISEKELTESFVKAFKDVVEPGLNNLQETVDDMNERLGRVENQLEKIDDRLDRHGTDIDKLKKRDGSTASVAT